MVRALSVLAGPEAAVRGGRGLAVVGAGVLVGIDVVEGLAADGALRGAGRLDADVARLAAVLVAALVVALEEAAAAGVGGTGEGDTVLVIAVAAVGVCDPRHLDVVDRVVRQRLECVAEVVLGRAGTGRDVVVREGRVEVISVIGSRDGAGLPSHAVRVGKGQREEAAGAICGLGGFVGRCMGAPVLGARGHIADVDGLDLGDLGDAVGVLGRERVVAAGAHPGGAVDAGEARVAHARLRLVGVPVGVAVLAVDDSLVENGTGRGVVVADGGGLGGLPGGAAAAVARAVVGALGRPPRPPPSA